MQGQCGGAQHADPALVQLVAVAVRAMEHMAAPALLQARYRWQRIGHARRQHQPAGGACHPAADLDVEGAIGLCRCAGFALQPFDGAVCHQLRAADGGDLGGRCAVPRQEAMRMVSEAVAALAAVDNQDASAGARQRQGSGQACIAASDDDGVVGHCWIHGEPSSNRSTRKGNYRSCMINGPASSRNLQCVMTRSVPLVQTPKRHCP